MTELGPEVQESVERLIREAEWRGRIQAQIEASDTRLEDSHKTILHRIDQFENNSNRRFDTVETQVRKTNGRVTDLEQVNENNRGQEDERQRLQQADFENTRTKLVVKVGMFSAVLGGSMGEIIHLIATHQL